MISLPDKFIQAIIGVHGENGRRWLDGFPELLRYCEAKWRLRLLPHYPLSYNFVAPVVLDDGSEAVLKLGVPSREWFREIEALGHLQGEEMVRVLGSEPDRGILLLERVRPGDTLNLLNNDDEATLTVARLIKKLHIPAPTGTSFPTTADWAAGLGKLRFRFDGAASPIPERMVAKAERLFERLHADAKRFLLLHGDLHHENILSGGGAKWIAIDPKGVIGAAEYGIIPYLMNHIPGDRPEEATRRRIGLFVKELQLDKGKIVAWAYAHAVLSAWWCVEDGSEGVEEAIAKARLFEALE